ncbi:hypothetical protein [Sporosarcina sp. E16_8]|uniref:hypothetical protein n=1 Tax=Sporosarcina sp. E16_8 TaxID=2789295 RepID=UPI001A92F697|nr:hypothetical protein [Sporosarcina sp. E16_8]MBO0589630.1 hypothetical protein [Sporosarcina sp. E16_8]
MGLKNRKKSFVLVGVAVFFLLFMTWLFPFSPISIYKSYTYKPVKVLYINDKSYEDILNEFKESYEKELSKEFKNTRNTSHNSINLTIDRTQYILPIFEQDWLVSTKPVTIDKNKVDQMLRDVIQSRNTLLMLVAQENYTSEERVYLVDIINSILRLEEEIRYVKDGKYFSRIELNTLLDNLGDSFRFNFDIFVTTFYERVNKE